jgi:hypothetical protein
MPVPPSQHNDRYYKWSDSDGAKPAINQNNNAIRLMALLFCSVIVRLAGQNVIFSA